MILDPIANNPTPVYAGEGASLPEPPDGIEPSTLLITSEIAKCLFPQVNAYFSDLNSAFVPHPSGSHAGGYALRIEVTNSDGARYTSDTLAINTSEGPRLMNVVFWSSSGIAIGNTTNDVFDVCGAAQL